MTLCVLYDETAPFLEFLHQMSFVISPFSLLLVPCAFKRVSDVSVSVYSHVYANEKVE